MYQAVFKRHAELMKALANPKRLEVIHLLRQGVLAVSEMERMLGLRQANLSQHLMILRRVGVVATERRGKEIYYRLSHRNFALASQLLRSVLFERLGKKVNQATSQLKVSVDPVCGMRLTPTTAASSRISKGKRYYFCGVGCAREFNRS